MERSEKMSFAFCPSLRRAGIGDGDDGFAVSAVLGDSPPQISVAARRDGDHPSAAEGDGDDDSSDDFEFPFVLGGDESCPAITADEIFADGRLRPAYPVFGRKLIPNEKPPLPPPTLAFGRKLTLKEDSRPAPPATAAEEQEQEVARVRLPLRQLLYEERNSSVGSTSSSSSSLAAAAELDGIPKDSYCLWMPASAPSSSPAQCRKSGSTGSRLQWRRLSELVVRRSHSDGNAKFLFLAAAGQEEKEKGDASPYGSAKEGKAAKKGKGKADKITEMDAATAHRVLYGKAAQGGAAAAATRQTFLPYRQDLFALFGNVKGLTRSHHPF